MSGYPVIHPMNRALKVMIHVFMPLFIGGWIYISCRTPNLLVFDLLYLLQIDPTPIRVNYDIPHFVKYCLPDGCWVYAGTSWMLLIWGRLGPWIYLYVLLAVGGEFGQLAGIVPGTFEWFDVIACLLGFYIPLLVLRKCTKNISGQYSFCY